MGFPSDHRPTAIKHFQIWKAFAAQLFLAWLLAVVGHVTALNAQSPQHDKSSASFSLVSQRDPILTLKVPMRFHTGDNPRWSDPGFDDSGWPLQLGDRNWKALGLRDLSGLAWYRFTVTLPPGDDAYSIELPHIRTAYQLFIDGRLSVTAGDMPPHPGMYITFPQIVALPNAPRSRPATIQIALRIWQDPVWAAYEPGGPQGPMRIGRTTLITERFDSERLNRYWKNSDWFDLTVLELFASLAALALFLLGRCEHEYLWFSILALGSSLNHAIRLWARFHAHPVHVAESLECAFYSAYLVATLMFYRKLLAGRTTPAFRLALVSCALWFLTTQLAVLPQFSARAENTAELIFSAPVYLWELCLIFRRARQRQPDARLLALPVALLTGTCFYYQLLFTIGTFGHPQAMKYYPIFRNFFYADTKDIAETFFLIAMLLILGHRFARTRLQTDRTTAELEAARSVQRVLVPETLPSIPGMAIMTAYYPAQEVGGDFFQIMPLPSGDTLVIIGDVAGKGVPAALTVSLIVGVLRTLVDYVDGPANILAGLNRRLYGRESGFSTCLAMQFSADRDRLTIANAGHLPAYADQKELASEVNLPLGMLPEVLFEESVYPLHPGMHIVVLTDGVPEAMCKRELFGFGRTCALSGESATTIADAARSFGQTDDITVLSIEVIAQTALWFSPQSMELPMETLPSHHQVVTMSTASP